ncbi:MAG: ABC transporter ATP-binding protein [Gemmatimonadaceae bacterium]
MTSILPPLDQIAGDPHAHPPGRASDDRVAAPADAVLAEAALGHAAPALLETRGLCKSYRRSGQVIPVLRAIDFRCPPGALLAIAGPSGGGKSTLLNLLGLLDSPSAGDYLVDGVAVNGASPAERTRIRRATFGFIFQAFNLVPVLSAVENVELALSVLGVGRREARERSMAMLERAGLADRAHHRPDELSGGQQQRVAIARALVKHPRVVFADEPTANLDSRSTTRIMELVETLNASERVAFVIATHDPLVYDRARTVHRLHDGELAGACEGGGR